MQRTSVFFAILLTSAVLVAGLSIRFGAPVAAQEPDTVGAAVPVADADGLPIGSITVTEVSDPFTEFDPAYPPEAGSRYVALTVAFDADAGARFDIAPWTIVLQDAAGFLWDQSSIVLPDEALVPELSSQTLAPGSRVTGLVGFVLPEGSAPARVYYQPESSRLVPLADLLGEDAPNLGDAVAIVDSEGGSGTVTVAELTDPFEAVEPGQSPPEGARFVFVTLIYENSGAGRFFVEPSGLLLRDANGGLWSATSVSRPDETEIIPDLTRAQLAPGDRLSGAAVFAVPEGTGVAGIYTSPVSGQLIQLADLEVGGDTESAPPGGTPAAEPDEDVSASVADDACADLEPWLASTRERIRRAGEMSVEDATLADLDSMAEHMSEYAALAEAQLAESTPPEAEAAGQALAATLNAYSGAIEQILGAADPGKDTVLELAGGMNTFNAAGARLQESEAELASIAGECGLS